jgi:hypothetical protein
MSGASPLNSLNFKPQSQTSEQCPIPSTFQKISPESYSSSSSSNENFISVKPKKKRNGQIVKLDVHSDNDEAPSFQLKNMKSGMIEFKVRDITGK